MSQRGTTEADAEPLLPPVAFRALSASPLPDAWTRASPLTIAPAAGKRYWLPFVHAFRVLCLARPSFHVALATPHLLFDVW